jgi:hypothetical protein
MKPTSIANPFASKGEFQEPPLPPKPIRSSSYELHQGLVAMVRAIPFSGHDDENPCQHLLDFEEIYSCLSISGHDTRNLKVEIVSLLSHREGKIESTNGD